MADVNIPNTTPTYKHWNIGDNWTVDRNWTWHETYVWTLEVNETLKFSESYTKKEFDVKKSETFKVVDKRPAFVYSAAKSEAFKAIDAIGFKTTFNLKLSEAWKISSKYGNTVTLPFADSFSMYDTLLRPAQGVMSDLMFEDASEWTLNSMATYMFKGKHAGYENFKPFIAGDYTYDKALFRTAIEAASQDRGLIEQWQITVDVPDINDRGSAEVVDANYELKVLFNQTFHIAPEVVCTIRSGASAAPITINITEITETYFKVQLVNSLTGKATTGRFIWSAQGY